MATPDALGARPSRAPVSVLVGNDFATVAEFAGLGVRRIRVGGALARLVRSRYGRLCRSRPVACILSHESSVTWRRVLSRVPLILLVLMALQVGGPPAGAFDKWTESREAVHAPPFQTKFSHDSAILLLHHWHSGVLRSCAPLRASF